MYLFVELKKKNKIMTQAQKKEFDLISKQIIKFMAENFHPHNQNVQNN